MATGWFAPAFKSDVLAIIAHWGPLAIGLIQEGPPAISPVDPSLYVDCDFDGYGEHTYPEYPLPVFDYTKPVAQYNFPPYEWTVGTTGIPQDVTAWYVKATADEAIRIIVDVSPALVVSTPGQVVSLTLGVVISGSSVGMRAALGLEGPAPGLPPPRGSTSEVAPGIVPGRSGSAGLRIQHRLRSTKP